MGQSNGGALNPEAAVFVPKSATKASEDFLTADQAFEIETCQNFVELCAYLESMEEAHLVAYFLATADAEKVAEVQRRVTENLRLSANANMMERMTRKPGTA